MTQPQDNQQPHRSQTYDSHLRSLTQTRLRIASCLIAVVFALDGTFEAIFRPTAFRQTFWIRIAVIGGCLTVYCLTRLRSAPRYIYGISVMLIIAVAVDVQRAMLATGGLSSPYYAGLLLLLVGVGLLAPIGLRLMSGVAGLIWLVFLSPIAFQANPTLGTSFSASAFFLMVGTVVSLVACRATSSLREREFFSQQALQKEQEKSERLLLNVLPQPIADRLKDNQQSIADGFAEATVLFADIAGFTTISKSLPPEQIVDLLNRVFSEFDLLAEKLGLEKIKTIGDAYMVAGGLPEPREDHAEAVADMALGMIASIAKFEFGHDRPLQMRIGINTGPVVAGVIGVRKFIYDLWGDTVNTASRMESHGIIGSIQVTQSTYDRLEDKYLLDPRGTIEVKGKGSMETYLLTGKRR